MAKKKLSDKQKLRLFFQEQAAGSATAEPVCRHFGDCGGCEFQNIPYERQLDMKRRAFAFIADEAIADLKARAKEPEDAESWREKAALAEQYILPLTPDIIPSPLPLGYRQRMDYVFAFDKAGLRRVNRHRQVVELAECPLLGDAGFAVFQKALRLAREHGLESYDYMRHHGELRYFVVRRSRAGGVLLSLVTKTRHCEQAVRTILETLVADRDIVSGHWLLAEGLGDVSFGEPLLHVGEECIFETMLGTRLGIGPNTFFQSNPAVAETAYSLINAFVPEQGVVLDMYAGVGSIGLSVGKTAARVLAVENVPENVRLARMNIMANGSGANTELVEDDAAQWLARAAEAADAPRPDLVIVNPPRPGVDAKGMEAIKRLGPPRVAYLSCNPFTLIRDLAYILDMYEIRELRLFDMFPQTRHFESLALLEKRSSAM